MEESQIAALPPDLAAEAQSLRREWESRNRQFLQDRLFSHGHHPGTTLSSILRNSGDDFQNSAITKSQKCIGQKELIFLFVCLQG